MLTSVTLENFFTIIFFIIYFFFMETESVSEVSGPHDMEAIEKKIIISTYYIHIYKTAIILY